MPEGHAPFAIWNRTGNRAVAVLLRSPLHPLLSGRLALISVTGRRSRHSYTFPVGYRRAGDCVTIPVGWPARKVWWRNLRGGARVQLRMGTRNAAASPTSAATSALESSSRFNSILSNSLARLPGRARETGLPLRRRDAEAGTNLTARCGPSPPRPKR